MRCPKCGFLTFDHVEKCKQCGSSFTTREPPLGPPAMAAPVAETVAPLHEPEARPDHRATDEEGSSDPATAPTASAILGGEPGRPAIRPASLWRRSLAAQIDGGVVFAVCLVGVIAVVLTVQSAADLGGTPEQGVVFIAVIASLVAWVVLSAAYHIAFVGAWSQTPGQRAMGIRLITMGGGPMGYGRAALRWIGIVIADLTFGLGYLPILLTRTRRGLHDFLAGSQVVET